MNMWLQVLFEEMAKLLRYTPKLEDFPVVVAFEDEARMLAQEGFIKRTKER